MRSGVSCRQYGKDYVAVEDAAHQAHKGMWQGKFQLPADWRKDQKIEKLLAEKSKREAAGMLCQCTHLVTSALQRACT